MSHDLFPDRPRPLPWLTVLRYPAALAVVLVHSIPPGQDLLGEGGPAPSWSRLVMEHGYLGVSFFFVLSGFILAYNYPVISSGRAYLINRAARILPIYYLSLLFSLPGLIAAWVAYGLAVLPITLCVLTLTQAWIPPMSSFWNGPAWSLSCEIFFYVVFLWMILPLRRWCSDSRFRIGILFLICFILGMIAPALYYLKYDVNPQVNVAFASKGDAMQVAKLYIERLPLLRLLEFVAGVLLCLGVRSHLQTLTRHASLMILAGFFWLMSSLAMPFIFSMGTYCLPGFALLIVGAAASPFPSAEGSGPVVGFLAALGITLGNASYAIYLFHVIVMQSCDAWSKILLARLSLHGDGFIWGYFLIMSLLTTLLSIVIYHGYETPMRNRIKNRWANPSPAHPHSPGRSGGAKSRNGSG